MQARINIPLALGLIILISCFLFVPEAYSQVNKNVSSILDKVLVELKNISVVIFTICIVWAGYKMAFRGARWSDVAYIVIGGILIGASGQIADLLLK